MKIKITLYSFQVKWKVQNFVVLEDRFRIFASCHMPIFSPGQTENLNVFPNFSVDCSRIYASCHRCFPRENFSRLNSWPWAAAINLSWHVVSFTSARAGKIARFLHRFTFSGPCWHPSPSPLGLFPFVSSFNASRASPPLNYPRCTDPDQLGGKGGQVAAFTFFS